MTNQNIRLVALAIACCAAAPFAQAQDANLKGDVGYIIDQRGTAWRNGSGQCWRTSYWTPAMAIEACDPDLVKKPETPRPAPAPAAAPAPAPAPAPAAAPAAAPTPAPAPAAAKPITISAKALFDFNKSVLKPEGQGVLDREVLAKLGGMSKITSIIIEGHADRLGNAIYNQKLSERRAEAVKAYLVGKGVDANLIETFGYGKTQPDPMVKCDDKLKRKDMIECLAPNRRVVVQVKGMPK